MRANRRVNGPILTIHSCIEPQGGEAGGVPSGLSKSFSNTVAFRNNKIDLMSILNRDTHHVNPNIGCHELVALVLDGK